MINADQILTTFDQIITDFDQIFRFFLHQIIFNFDQLITVLDQTDMILIKLFEILIIFLNFGSVLFLIGMMINADQILTTFDFVKKWFEIRFFLHQFIFNFDQLITVLDQTDMILIKLFEILIIFLNFGSVLFLIVLPPILSNVNLWTWYQPSDFNPIGILHSP